MIARAYTDPREEKVDAAGICLFLSCLQGSHDWPLADLGNLALGVFLC